MCQCFAGSILVSFHGEDPFTPAALDQSFAGDRVRFLDQSIPEHASDFVRDLPHRFAQIAVRPGDEGAEADRLRVAIIAQVRSPGDLNYFQDLFSHAELAPLISQEAVVTTGSSIASSSSSGFSFSDAHSTLFVPSLGLNTRPATARYAPQIAVLDSGWSDPGTGATVVGQVDLTESGGSPGNPSFATTAPDVFGHGTMIGAIIHDIAPAARLSVYRVAQNEATREWTFLAGLAAAASDECDVVNASVGFGLDPLRCPHCKRDDTHTTRSLVFHRFLQDVLNGRSNLVFVAAAGNGGQAEPVAFPARFRESVCVGSHNGLGEISTFSSIDTPDERDQTHPAFVLAPGGDQHNRETQQGSDVFVGASHGRGWNGTSFAAAYVTGLIAAHLASAGRSWSYDVISALVAAAHGDGIESSGHGFGLAQAF